MTYQSMVESRAKFFVSGDLIYDKSIHVLRNVSTGRLYSGAEMDILLPHLRWKIDPLSDNKLPVSGNKRPTELQVKLIEEILLERAYQDRLFGPAHQRETSEQGWQNTIHDYTYGINQAEQHVDDFEIRMIKVAALALAALEQRCGNRIRENKSLDIDRFQATDTETGIIGIGSTAEEATEDCVKNVMLFRRNPTVEQQKTIDTIVLAMNAKSIEAKDIVPYCKEYLTGQKMNLSLRERLIHVAATIITHLSKKDS